jgi:hypothetical protein
LRAGLFSECIPIGKQTIALRFPQTYVHESQGGEH